MFTPPLDRAGVRKLLEQIPTDADFDAFCLDFFPAAQARYSAGMDRVQKTTLLLQVEPDPGFIADKLRQRFANLAMGEQARAIPRRWRGLLFAGVGVALLLASGLLIHQLRANRPTPVAPPLEPSLSSPRPPGPTSDAFAQGPPPPGGRVAVEQAGDIHAKGRVNITAPPGAQDTSVTTRGQIEAGGDVNIGVTTPTAPSSVPRSRDVRP